MECHILLFIVSTKCPPLINPGFIIQATHETGNMEDLSGQEGLIAFYIKNTV